MQILNRPELEHLRASERAPPDRWTGLMLAAAGALAAGGAGFTAALFLLPPALVLPVTATGLILAAAMLAVLAWASPGEVGRSRIVFWDMSGALAVIGLCAALFGETEQAVALLERDRM